MNGGICKARTRRPRATLSKALQETLLAAITNSSEELVQNLKDQPPADGDISPDAPLQFTKRPPDATTDIDPLPAKRARLTQTPTQQLRVKEETSEHADKPILQQPKPKPTYASFLKDFVDPVHSVHSVHSDSHSTSVHSLVSEWLESVRSDREERCRSDSHLHSSNGDLTRSESKMGFTKDADGYALPPTPASTGSRPRRPSTSSRVSDAGASVASSPSFSVRNRMYRQNNLALNNVYILPSATPLPDLLSSHVEKIRARRDSPRLSSDDMNQIVGQLDALAEGCDEEDVAAFLNNTIFPNPKTDSAYGPTTGLMSSSNALISQHLIPSNPISPYKITQPKPDKLYGYSGNPNTAFTQEQMLAQSTLHPTILHYPAATSQGLRFPFFAIEFKAAGGTQGDLWVATNQGAGASSACLNAVDRLNILLQKYGSKRSVDNLAHVIVVDNNTAQLYISWKEDDLKYYLQRVNAFLLSSSEHIQNFRDEVRNILDWGKDTHLTQIKEALDIILEENRKKAAEDAKSRQPPSDDGTSDRKKHKSSSRRDSSISSSLQARGEKTNEPCWGAGDTTQLDVYPEINQQNQSLSLAAKQTTPQRSTLGSTSSFDAYGPGTSHGPPSSHYLPPYWQQNLIGIGNYVSQHNNDKSTFPEHHLSEDDQQVQGQIFVPSDAGTGPLAGFTIDSPTKELPTAGTDEYWRWSRSRSRKIWYHPNEDGSRESYKG